MTHKVNYYENQMVCVNHTSHKRCYDVSFKLSISYEILDLTLQ